jgi:hypothetical protein
MVANRLRDAAAVLEVDSAYRRDAAIMREAADEVDRLRHDIERHVEIACELATECERLRAELAASREDVERYRWLRDQCRYGDLTIAVCGSFELLPWCGDDADKAIDAARKGEGEI